MPEVSFYVLPAANEMARIALLLKLVEKAYAAKEPTFLYFEDVALMQRVDRMIWEINDTAFLPHAIIESIEDLNDFDFIYLSDREWSLPNHSLLINLHSEIPKAAKEGKFPRIFELITQEPAVLHASRDHYRVYRDLGFSLQTHKL